MPAIDHVLTIDEVAHAVWLSRAGRGYLLHTGGGALAVELHDAGARGSTLTVAGKSEPVVVAVIGDDVHVHLDGNAYTLRYSDALKRLSQHGLGAADDQVLAPMPGTVIAVQVAAGAEVRRGEPMLVIESMKLETTIGAPRDGVVQAVHVEIGRSFERDAILVSLAPAAGGTA